MDALRNTINTQSIKTKQITFQYPDGTFPEPGAILNVTDTKGHTDWTREPNLDSITLVAPNSTEGTLTYSNTGDLELNGVPVGGGGGSVSGGTNITISGGSTVNFDPTKGGGVNMLAAPMTNTSRVQFATDVNITCNGSSTQKAFHTTNASGGAEAAIYYTGDYASSFNGSGMEYNAADKTLIVNKSVGPLLPNQGIKAVGEVRSTVGSDTTAMTGKQINFAGSGKISTVNFDTAVGDGTLTVTNLTNTPEFRVAAGSTTITARADAGINANTITMATNNPAGVSSLNMTNGANNASVNYSELTTKLTVSSDNNLSIFASNATHTIEMGPSLGGIFVSTQDQPIMLIRKDAGGGAIDTMITTQANGIVQIGEATAPTKPTLYFQGDAPSYAQIEFDNTTSQLTISGSGGGVTSTKIATPLFDVASNTAGNIGDVLTSQGPGMPPIWASGGAPVVLQSKTYTAVGPSSIVIDSAEFSVLPSVGVSSVTLELTLQGGGGGGGGGLGIGSPGAGGIMSGGGGGGGGAAYLQTLTLTVPYGETCNLTVGDGGPGGGGAQILLGSTEAGAGIVGDATIVAFLSLGGSYSAAGGSGGGGGGGSQAGGAGSVPGSSGSFTPSGPGASGGDDGGGIVFGGAGGGLYGGLGGVSAGGSYGSPAGAAADMAGGQGLGGAAAYSGAGGGGGSGGAGGYGQAGGKGAPGYATINILSFA